MVLSIIITSHQTPDLLKLCLSSIKGTAIGLEHEIIAVDCETQEETSDMMAEFFPEIKFISFKENIGYDKMVNVGLERATGDYILLLNADIVLMPGALAKMLDYLVAHREVGILGPQLLNFDGSVQNSCFRFYRPVTILFRRTVLGKTSWGKKELARFTMSDFDHRTTREVDWLMGSALMVRREALVKVGPMDERFFMYFEDTDWCRRFWQNGWRVIYFPEAQMYHYHGQSSKKTKGLADLLINKYTWIHIASALKYFWKYRR